MGGGDTRLSGRGRPFSYSRLGYWTPFGTYLDRDYHEAFQKANQYFVVPIEICGRWMTGAVSTARRVRAAPPGGVVECQPTKDLDIFGRS